MKNLSIAFQTDKALADYGPLAARAEALGFNGISVYNDILFQPAWLPLLEIARHTSAARIGVAAVNPYTCHPINIAGNMSLIAEVAPGRNYLGLARGGWLDFVGIAGAKPIESLSQAMICIRHLLSGNKDPLDQELYPLQGGDSLRWGLPSGHIPFLLGSWGEKTIAACHDHCNEIKLGGSANPAVVLHYKQVLDQLGASAHTEIVMGAVTVIDENPKLAKHLAKKEVALYLPVVAELDKTLEIDPAILNGVKAAAAIYDFEAAAGFISDELLTPFAMAGTPADVIAQCEAVFEAGAARIEFGTPHGLTASSGLELLGEHVLPALRAGLGSWE